jgi:hypothetical protein
MFGRGDSVCLTDAGRDLVVKAQQEDKPAGQMVRAVPHPRRHKDVLV